MKRVIVNADDFGLTRGVNRAIAECHRHGIVTSATLMAGGAAFEDAVRLAGTLPALSVGCHVVLVDGAPLLPASQVRSLLKPGTDRFYDTISEFARAALAGRLRAGEIEAEADAQFERLRAAGIAISHFDAHKHAHIFPAVLEPLLRAAKHAGIAAVRNPFERALAMPLGKVLSSRKLALRWAEVLALRGFRGRFCRLVRAAGLQTPDGCIGVALTGLLNSTALDEMLQRLPQGTWELVCHPGYNDAELDTVRTRLRESREHERITLADPLSRIIAERAEISLISYMTFVGAALTAQAR